MLHNRAVLLEERRWRVLREKGFSAPSGLPLKKEVEKKGSLGRRSEEVGVLLK